MDSITRRAVIHGVDFTFLYATRSKPSSTPSNLHFPSNSQSRVRFKISSSFNRKFEENPVIRKIKNTTGALILTATTALMIGKFSVFPARAENPISIVEQVVEEKDQEQEKLDSESIDALKCQLERKIKDGEDEEALEILKRLISVETMGRLEVRNILEEILAINPLNYEVLLQKSLIMETCGESQIALQQLEQTLKLAYEEQKMKETRDVRLIIAQIHYLQKNIDEAMKIYQDLIDEDPEDYRPFFCQGVIFCLLDLIDEANERFAKCKEIYPLIRFEAMEFSKNPLSNTADNSSGQLQIIEFGTFFWDRNQENKSKGKGEGD